jgi:hypothetical protein
VLSSHGQLSNDPVNSMHTAVTSVNNRLLIIVTQIYDTAFVIEVTNLQIYLQVFEKKCSVQIPGAETEATRE